MSDDRADLEMALVRILATDGLILSGINAEDRRERIRVAIVQRGLKDKRWPLDRSLTYGQAFERCYRRQVEMRRMQRDEQNRPMAYRDFNGAQALREGPGDDDDAGEDDEDEGATGEVPPDAR